MTVSTDLAVTFTSMASDIKIRVVDPARGAREAVDRAVAEIDAIATHLTRFDPESALSKANRAPDAWHEVPAVLADAISAAHSAHRVTQGLFDPRVGSTLAAWGYDKSFERIQTEAVGTTSWDIDIHRTLRGAPVARATWKPTVTGTVIHLGGSPIDLGGIGKGLAIRWAATVLATALPELDAPGSGALLEAGGDLVARGSAPQGGPWMVAIEDPFAAEEPAIVALQDGAICTSSVAVHRWRTVDGRDVHHLLDPRTGEPGGEGLVSVTVSGPDPAWAEVWSKTLFLEGAAGIGARARAMGLAAWWVRDDGSLEMTPAARERTAWVRGED